MIDLNRQSWLSRPPENDRFGLLVVLLITALMVSGVSNDGSIRSLTGVLNLCALLVGFRQTRSQMRLWTMVGLLGAGSIAVVLVQSGVSEVAVAVGATVQVVILAALTLAIFARVFEHDHVSNQTIFGAIAGLLLLGQVYAWLYLALPGYLGHAVLEPQPGGEIPIYYSYVVLTTLGFGDIKPIGALTERITVTEALMGQLYIAIVLSRLVSLYSRGQPTANPTHGEQA